MNRRPSLGMTFLFAGSIIAFSAILWLLIFTNMGDGQKTPRMEMLLELSKTLGQLALVTVLGATVTFLYNGYAKEQEQFKTNRDEDNKLRRGLLNSLIDVRAQVEKTRREFRLLPSREKKAEYIRTIKNLLEARLRLSQIWHDAETWKELYSDDSPKIQKGLTGMKVYLDNLISEYEAKLEIIQKARNDVSLRMIAE